MVVFGATIKRKLIKIQKRRRPLAIFEAPIKNKKI